MKLRRALSLLLVCVVAGAVIAAIGQRLFGGGNKGYVVRAVFDNSSFVNPGEQVKIAGVVVGNIGAVQLTPQNHAAVVLDITNRQFTPFHTNAHCEIDLQSLLGEQYVQCTPSQIQAPGTAPAPVLPAIRTGPNAGEHLLTAANTTTPVGVDLLQDIYQLPERQGLQLIIAGLGAGLDHNGKALNQALINADPALKSTNQVISVLADQTRTLAALTDDSAKVLGPLAAQSKHIGGFISHAGADAAASAQESQAIEANLQDFPGFLKQLTPATQRLAGLANSMIPSLDTLNAQAPTINASLRGLGPLAKASIPALKTLGGLAAKGETVFPQVNTEVHQLLSLATPLRPLSTNIAAVAKSFDKAGGIEDVMRFIYYYTGAVNGEDALGHYVRTLLEIGSCSARSQYPVGGCGANFVPSTSTSSGSVAAIARRAVAQASRTLAKTSKSGSSLSGMTKYLFGK